MALPKLYDRVYWDNNTTPAINEDNLNSLSKAVDDIDDRVISLAGTIMEDVPQIQEDLEILEPAIENIDSNVERAETAADDAEDSAKTAEYWANVSNPPIPVVKDFASVISVDDAIPKAATDVKVKIEAVQDLHGYTKPWVGGAGKNLLRIYPNYSVEQNGITVTGIKDSAGNQIGLNVNGRATADCAFTIFGKGIGDSFAPLAGKTLKIYGGANSNSNVYMQCASSNGFWGNDTTGSGSSAFTVESTEPSNWNAQLIVKNGTQLNNVKIYPMICLASASSDYEPYSNICPISGFTEVKLPRTGKNLLPSLNTTRTKGGLTFTKNDDGSITVNGTNTFGSTVSYYVASASDNENTSLSYPVGEYVLAGAPEGGGTSGNYKWFMSLFYGQNSSNNYGTFDFGSGATYTLTNSNNTGMGVRIGIGVGQTINNLTFKPMLRLATETDATFTPYNGTDYIIDLDGTRYGGVLDVDAGNLVLTHTAVTITDKSQITGINSSASGNYAFVTGTSNIKTSDNEVVVISDGCIGIAFSQRVAEGYTSQFRCYSDTNGQAMAIRVPAGYNATTAEDFFAAFGNMTFVFELATPQTVTLTPTEVQMLQGYNVLSANSGDVYLKYDASMIQRIANEKLDISTFKSVVASSSDFADFKTKVAAL